MSSFIHIANIQHFFLGHNHENNNYFLSCSYAGGPQSHSGYCRAACDLHVEPSHSNRSWVRVNSYVSVLFLEILADMLTARFLVNSIEQGRLCEATLTFQNPDFLLVHFDFKPLTCLGFQQAEITIPQEVPNGDAFILWFVYVFFFLDNFASC